MRDAVENGFEVIAIEDATGAAGEAALEAAQTNYGFIAHATVTADEAVDLLCEAGPQEAATDGGQPDETADEAGGFLDRPF